LCDTKKRGRGDRRGEGTAPQGSGGKEGGKRRGQTTSLKKKMEKEKNHLDRRLIPLEDDFSVGRSGKRRSKVHVREEKEDLKEKGTLGFKGKRGAYA